MFTSYQLVSIDDMALIHYYKLSTNSNLRVLSLLLGEIDAKNYALFEYYILILF